MKGPAAFSVVLHAVFIIVAIVGLPYIKPDLPDIDTSIAVELVDVADMTQAHRKQDKPQEKEMPQPPQDKEAPPKPAMPTVTAAAPPKPTPPVPPAKIEPKPPEKTEVAPSPDELAAPDKTQSKVPAKIPPKPVQRPVLTQAAPPDQQEQFQSLLRNLMPEQEDMVKSDTPRAGEQSSLAQSGPPMSMSEMDALRSQLTRSWSLIAGARYAEDLVVDVRIFVNPDRTVREAKIVDQLRYNTDSFFRAAAESALRAVYKSSPLDLPPEKYDQWKDIIVTFDPRTML